MITLDRAKNLDIPRVYLLYLRAFPASERKPFSKIVSMAKEGRTDLWIIRKDGRFAGFASTVNSPELVLLDEPTLGLDVLAKRQMIDFLKRINREKQVTMLVTSHDMDDLTEMANRILLLSNGTLAFDGNYDQLVQMAGDSRIIKLILPGDAPKLDGAEYIGKEDGRHLYRYDASRTTAQQIFGAISQVPDVQDVELGHEAVEQVIARLYQNML